MLIVVEDEGVRVRGVGVRANGGSCDDLGNRKSRTDLQVKV